MKSRESQLKKLLSNCQPTEKRPALPVLKAEDIQKAGYWKELDCIYRRLGGKLPEPPLKFGPWDLVCGNRLIELDEEQHFNRYRGFTLTASLYDLAMPFDVITYRHWCMEMEELCLRKASHGGYWTNRSTRAQFGPGSAPGDLINGGSPRWKQRAWYDYLKDLYGKIYGILVVRLSIYEMVEGRRLGECLREDSKLGNCGFPNLLKDFLKF